MTLQDIMHDELMAEIKAALLEEYAVARNEAELAEARREEWWAAEEARAKQNAM